MFESLFRPTGIVVIGSASPGKLGNVLVNRLIQSGYNQVFSVNPKGQGVGKRPGYTSCLLYTSRCV